MSKSQSAYDAYSPKSGEHILVPSVVLFLDVMGVELGACSEERLDFLRALRHALEEARSVGGIDEELLHVRAVFSDSLIAAFPLQGGVEAEDVIQAAEVMAARVQLELLNHGFFLRGGLAFGDHYMDPDFAFGPALVEAAMLERKAVVPRVVLSDEARNAELTAFKRSSDDEDAPQRQYLISDSDGITFISYLDVVMDVDDEAEAHNWLDRHQKTICDKLREHAGRSRIESKYLWAARYHNHVCAHRTPASVGCEHLIALDSLPGGLEDFGWDVPMPQNSFSL